MNKLCECTSILSDGCVEELYTSLEMLKKSPWIIQVSKLRRYKVIIEDFPCRKLIAKDMYGHNNVFTCSKRSNDDYYLILDSGERYCPWRPFLSITGLDKVLKMFLKETNESNSSNYIFNPLPIPVYRIYENDDIIHLYYFKPMELKRINVRESTVYDKDLQYISKIGIEVSCNKIFFKKYGIKLVFEEHVRECSYRFDGVNLIISYSDGTRILVHTIKNLVYIDAKGRISINFPWINAYIYFLNPYTVYSELTDILLEESGQMLLNSLWIGLWNNVFIGLVNPLLKDIVFEHSKMLLNEGKYIIYLSSQRELSLLHNIGLASIVEFPEMKGGLRKPFTLIGDRIYDIVYYTPSTIYLMDYMFDYDNKLLAMVFVNPSTMSKKLRVITSWSIDKVMYYDWRHPGGVETSLIKPNIVEHIMLSFDIIVLKIYLKSLNIEHLLIKNMWKRVIGVR